jgi:hypothetical protein
VDLTARSEAGILHTGRMADEQTYEEHKEELQAYSDAVHAPDVTPAVVAELEKAEAEKPLGRDEEI